MDGKTYKPEFDLRKETKNNINKLLNRGLK